MLAGGRAQEAPFDEPRPRPDVDRWTARPLDSARRPPLKHKSLARTAALHCSGRASRPLGLRTLASPRQDWRMTQPAFDFTKLSPEERLDLIGEIWDSLENEALPISQELQAELDRRLADLEENPSDGRPAAEVIARIRATLR